MLPTQASNRGFIWPAHLCSTQASKPQFKCHITTLCHYMTETTTTLRSSSTSFRIVPPATMWERMARLRSLTALRQEEMEWAIPGQPVPFRRDFPSLVPDPGLLSPTGRCRERRKWKACETAPARESAPEPAPARESAPEPAPASEPAPVHESAPDSAPASAPACESAPVPTDEVGTEPPSHPRKRRKRRKKASFIPQGPEAFPERIVGPEATPEVLEPNAPPVSPDVAKRAVFVFYFLTVLCAWRTPLGSCDHGPEQPEPAAITEQPEPASSPKAVPEQSAPQPPRPSDLLKPTWSVPPAPTWCSARTPTWLEPPWSVPPAPPWPSVRDLAHNPSP
ncbi:hypothetical protein DPX16_4207 [Anabarilius grahami]|uniref:Uncharacterized protein n=1 Tax=Anabarilius grahami TaxID=495550 RepID=A0A3N0YR91_ANAGA|nr:hypothetical protein DPX16_4207 [Anabarilius grahami]